MELVQMDQSSLESVRKASDTILAKTNQVNILINNAAIMAIPERQLTDDGYELQFATYHLSHFLFFNLLKPALLAASSPSFQSWVVMVSAAAHRVHGINASDNYNFQNGGYTNVYMANKIERRHGARGLHATSFHPGIIATGIALFLPAEQLQAMQQDPVVLKVLKTPEQGAATTL
ncbi:hypothetical protein NUU61_003078 [Penicillium alfredii]|uniref:Uncharacterized protein n=1 Tax=Penicillium alfredii TaxID=1506179 RepID=A0A9W9FSP3_9EURO|nr:uncharacterized protein NUU61_003078 [Penicillium alfredii]KAJ5105731.1 hypothetical protein NUU61_003078 [Penicillium alfredii]